MNQDDYLNMYYDYTHPIRIDNELNLEEQIQNNLIEFQRDDEYELHEV